MTFIKKFLAFIIILVFGVVAASLHIIGKVFHLTYNEVNILLYYLFIPLIWCIIIDYYIQFPILTIIWNLLWIYIFITKRKFFKEWCDVVFNLSVDFLLLFQKIGLDYYKASVIICVIVPIVITYILLIL